MNKLTIKNPELLKIMFPAAPSFQELNEISGKFLFDEPDRSGNIQFFSIRKQYEEYEFHVAVPVSFSIDTIPYHYKAKKVDGDWRITCKQIKDA
jgi:hypothetical protein